MESIRRALPDDRESLADLIVLSDSGLLGALFRGEEHGAIAWFAGRPFNPFSHRHALLVEERGRTVGAALGSRVQVIRSEGLPTALLVLRYFGAEAPHCFVRLFRAGAATNGLHRSDFYLNNIAVYPKWRGHGYGARLLRKLEELERAEGARRVVLDVDPENDGALAFYRALGYTVEGALTLSPGAEASFHYLRMAKSLVVTLTR